MQKAQFIGCTSPGWLIMGAFVSLLTTVVTLVTVVEANVQQLIAPVVSYFINLPVELASREASEVSKCTPISDDTLCWPDGNGDLCERKVDAASYCTTVTAPFFSREEGYNKDKQQLSYLINKIDDYHERKLSSSRTAQMELLKLS